MYMKQLILSCIFLCISLLSIAQYLPKDETKNLNNKLLFEKIELHYNSNACDSSMFYAEHFFEVDPAEDSLLVQVLVYYIVCQEVVGEIEERLQTAKRLKAVLDRRNEASPAYIVLHRAQAQSYMLLDSVPQALAAFETALTYAQESDIIEYQMAIHADFANYHYTEFKELDRALEQIKQALMLNYQVLETAPSKENFQNQYAILNSIGVFFQEKGLLDSTNYYYGQITALIDQQPELLSGYELCIFYANRSSLLLELNQTQEALLEVKKARSYLDQTNNPLAAQNVYINLAASYLALHQLEQAKAIADTLIDLDQRFTDDASRINTYELISKIYQTDDPTQAYDYLTKAFQLKDSLYQKESYSDFNVLASKHEFELERQELMYEKQIWENKLRFQRLYLTFLSLLLFFAIVIALVLQMSRKKMRQLIDQLNESQLQLSASNKRLNHFVRSVSHDVIAKLEYILLAGNALVETGSESRQGLRDYYAESFKTARWLKSYCIDLLDWSKKGTITSQEKNTDVQEIVEDVLASYSSELNRRQFDVDIDLLPKVSMNATPLKQVIQNLIDNSIKYTRKEEVPKLQITSELKDDTYTILIKDNGIGFQGSEHQENRNVDAVHGRGLELITDLLNENGEKIWRTDNDWGGASVYFTLR